MAIEDEAQKMMALKKAYAEIILNTAKEAAARILASERRALHFQQELSSTKDEALRMLVRMKQMIDAKTAEAEMTSLNQQTKIEELEAQLNEAEDVITDLRVELKQVWLELEKTKNSQVQLLEGQIIKQVASFEESAKPETTVSSPIQESECVTTCDVKNEPLNQNVLNDKYCNATKQTELLYISNLEDYYASNSDVASIIMRGKEPELYKNGCTQRIRALEGSLLDDKLLTRDVHNGHFGVNNGFVVKDSDGEVAKFSTPSSKTEKMKIKKPVKCRRIQKGKILSCSCFFSSCKTQIDENYKSDNGACSLPSIKPFGINNTKTKKRRFRPVRRGSSVCEHCKPSSILKQCSYACNSGKCCEGEHDAKIKPVTHLTDVEPVHGSTSVTASIGVVSKFQLGQDIADKNNELLNAYILGNLAGSNSQKLTGPGCNVKVEVVDVPSTNTDLEDAKAFEENNGSSSQADDSKLLKYTFQRKRKKEALGNADEKTNSEKGTMKRRVEEKQNGASEPQKSSFVDESSRDSGCLAHVARQLISLSAKKW